MSTIKELYDKFENKFELVENYQTAPYIQRIKDALEDFIKNFPDEANMKGKKGRKMKYKDASEKILKQRVYSLKSYYKNKDKHHQSCESDSIDSINTLTSTQPEDDDLELNLFSDL